MLRPLARGARSVRRAHGCAAGRQASTTLLADEAIDALVLATPHSTHLPIIAAAAEAGQARLRGEAAGGLVSRRGRGGEGGARRRHRPAGRTPPAQGRRNSARSRQRVDDGAFGLIHLLEAKQTTPSDLTPRQGWRGDPAECPLGGMTALGVHMVDTIHYLAGPVREVYASSRQLLGRGRLDDITTLSLDLESGALATLTTSVVLPRETSIAIHGHDGSGWSEMDGAELYLQSPTEPARQREEVEVTDALAEQMGEFARCIRSGDDPEVAGRGRSRGHRGDGGRTHQRRRAPAGGGGRRARGQACVRLTWTCRRTRFRDARAGLGHPAQQAVPTAPRWSQAALAAGYRHLDTAEFYGNEDARRRGHRALLRAARRRLGHDQDPPPLAPRPDSVRAGRRGQPAAARAGLRRCPAHPLAEPARSRLDEASRCSASCATRARCATSAFPTSQPACCGRPWTLVA